MSSSERRMLRIVRDYIAALNARDFAAVERLVGADCRFIDSRGGWIRGRDDCLEASRRFFALPFEFHLHAEDVVVRADHVLIRGEMRSSHPGLARDSLWRARTEGEHLVEWQSFASGESLALAHLLMPEVAQHAWNG
jgi:ketosteroid isomerase-like protein